LLLRLRSGLGFELLGITRATADVIGLCPKSSERIRTLDGGGVMTHDGQMIMSSQDCVPAARIEPPTVALD
jgi:hypothetical protein